MKLRLGKCLYYEQLNITGYWIVPIRPTSHVHEIFSLVVFALTNLLCHLQYNKRYMSHVKMNKLHEKVATDPFWQIYNHHFTIAIVMPHSWQRQRQQQHSRRQIKQMLESKICI